MGPVNPVAGVNVKPPSLASDSVPLAGPASSTAVMAPPPFALSVPSTPGALTFSGVSTGVASASSVAMGAVGPPDVVTRQAPRPCVNAYR